MLALAAEALEAVDRRGVPQWIDLDKKGFTAKVKSEPAREDITMPIAEEPKLLLAPFTP